MTRSQSFLTWCLIFVFAMAAMALPGVSRGTTGLGLPAADRDVTRVPPAFEPPEFMVAEYAKQYSVSRDRAHDILRLQASGADLVDAAQVLAGDEFGGVWFDHDQAKFRVQLTSESARPEIDSALRARGLANASQVEVVRSSYEDLVARSSVLAKRLEDQLREQAIQVMVDVPNNAIKVKVASSRAQELDDLLRKEADADDRFEYSITEVPQSKLQIESYACGFPHCTTPIRGGVKIRRVTTGEGCTAGFVAYWYGNTGDKRVLTAGHCVALGGSWEAYRYMTGGWATMGPWMYNFTSPIDVGTVGIPGGAWRTTLYPQIVTWNTNYSVYSENWTVYDRARSYQGLFGCRFGITTPQSCGTVQDVAIWAYYDSSGVVGGLSRAVNACSNPGDSGSPWMSGNYAYGVQSGGAAPCDMYYTEVTDAENILGIRLVTTITGPI